MNLTIDQGNTFTKIGIFDKEDFIDEILMEEKEVERKIIELFAKYPIKNSILSSVVDVSDIEVKLLKLKSKRFIELSENTPLPIKNLYKTPATLGKDRIAAAVAVNYLEPKANNLAIDAGTCITYDFVSSQGEYLGGNISPGVDMRLKALNVFTKKLPLIEFDENYELLGNDTKTAILSGIVNGICFEMDGYIDTLKEKYSDLSVFLTGGNTFFFAKTLKNHIFAIPNLVLIGLNRILNYNV